MLPTLQAGGCTNQPTVDVSTALQKQLQEAKGTGSTRCHETRLCPEPGPPKSVKISAVSDIAVF